METELELTYLAKRLPEGMEDVTPQRIVDIYVPDVPWHSHLRLRQKDDKYYITKKMPVNEGDSSVQTENTILLTKEEFEALAKCSKKTVVKDRYKINVGGRLAEIDVFREKLEGLVLMDFEFETEEEKDSFIMPEEALADVTQEEFVAGGMLAGKSYEDLAKDLARFGYQKI